VLVVGVTAALVVLDRIAFLHPYLPRIAGGLTILGFVLLVHLMKRTALGSWLTTWKTLFDASQP
jgi:hypothetical protein